MKFKIENGIKWVSCDNVGEMLTEFKKFRNSKSAAERKSYNFDGWGGFMSMLRFGIIKHPNGKFSPSEIIDAVQIYQENGVDLSLNIAPLNFREKEWEPYHRKVKKTLKEIWETGEVKDYQGLDLDWPAFSARVCCDQCHKNIEGKLAWFSDREKDLDFCSKVCYSKYKKNKSLEKKPVVINKEIWLMIGTISFFSLALFFLAVWLKRKKSRKAKK